MNRELVLVGNPGEVHVGAHLRAAANALGLEPTFCDITQAFNGATLRQKIDWWVRGRRPTHLRKFSHRVVQVCLEVRPTWLICTGVAPVEGWALRKIGELGTRRLNYLTDDPWSSAHRAAWFLEALSAYDQVFSTKRSLLDELRRSGCPGVAYLPFAYAPEAHFPEQPPPGRGGNGLAADVVFVGGADRDRVPYMATLLRAGFQLALYGGYWERYRATAGAARGQADLRTSRQAVQAAKVALCLVRRTNRDGHCMRSFEVPAIGACMLTEDTTEHREIFGENGQAVVYFRTQEEMVERLRWLLAHDEDRHRLADAAHQLITGGKHTYRDRLETMLQEANR
ncbi:MAG TPA: glycosyltransferase [Verrucomicrobiae bacterium]|nr:glycosyltransferase [Verrucomicrobiae bacterium]